tara:strand:- start:385 stop:594 length:210 start_codon:yes stop_codon:yes gene_type:complete
MTFYSPTTPLPSPPYTTLDDIVIALCDRCLEIHDCEYVSEEDKQQLFDLTMSLMNFWEKELDWASHGSV